METDKSSSHVYTTALLVKTLDKENAQGILKKIQKKYNDVPVRTK